MYYCYDLDGVICEDCDLQVGTQEYADFLKNAKLLFSPSKDNINDIVTGRTEEYREITEEWLKKNNIHYNNLIIKPISLKGVKNTPKYKADYFKSVPATIFVESHTWQAIEIAKLSGKKVFSVENRQYYNATEI